MDGLLTLVKGRSDLSADSLVNFLKDGHTVWICSQCYKLELVSHVKDIKCYMIHISGK